MKQDHFLIGILAFIGVLVIAGIFGTSIVRETSAADGDPYYPIPRPQNEELYARYRALAPSDIQAVAQSFLGPGRVVVGVDLRHPSVEGLEELEHRATQLIQNIASQEKVEARVEVISRVSPPAFDPGVAGLIEKSFKNVIIDEEDTSLSLGLFLRFSGVVRC